MSIHLTITLSDDPTLARIGWAAVRQPGELFVVVSTLIPRWRQEVAPLEAGTDEEYAAFELSLPPEEQARRARVHARYPGLSYRRSIIRNRTIIGRAGRYGDHLTHLPVVERQRRDAVLGGRYSVTFPALR